MKRRIVQLVMYNTEPLPSVEGQKPFGEINRNSFPQNLNAIADLSEAYRGV
jgi:hypothetical protein